MAALKHLLNDDSESDAFNFRRPGFPWQDSGYLSEDPEPSLQVQQWDHMLHDIFGPEPFLEDLHTATVDSQSLRDTQADIEQWATGDVVEDLSQPPTLVEEVSICYGTVFRAAIKLCGSMAELDKKLSLADASPIQGHALLGLEKIDEGYFVIFSDKSVLGEVNVSLEKSLASISDQQFEIEYEVFAPVRAIREKIGQATKEKDAIVRVQITIYGPRNVATSIGKELSQQKIYLQRPDHVRIGVEYDNPHVLRLMKHEETFEQTNCELVEVIPEKATEIALKDTISNVYSSLTRNQNLKVIETDERLRTPLLHHQKTALDFMTQRENGPIPDTYRLWQRAEVDGQPCHRHSVTNTICRIEPPDEIGGGILADEMGMGKSLSVLALILRTLDAAHQWSNQSSTGPEDTSLGWNSRSKSSATLIVASSDLMINEWFQELDKHFATGTRSLLRTVKYHGQKRGTELEKLRNADIVITTYHTLASEVTHGKSVVTDMEWYRLVLDEAHIIRRQSTVLYRTVAGIPARSRWCLTGTPIQNKLEDIGSLLAFLRFEPFHNLSTFRKFIALPFDEGGKRRKASIERFTRLLDSVCLRRTKDLLHLPEQENHTRQIHLSQEERYQYEQTHKTMFRAIRHQNGVYDQKSTLGMFQVQLQLRILCNHGTWQQPFSWNRRKLHLLDEREAKEALLGREGEATCSACRQTLPLFGSGNMFQRYEDCRHVLCTECVEENAPQDQENLPSKCLLCKPLWSASTATFRSKQTSQEDMYFRPSGRSTKMDALMSDVMVNVFHTKSIIFTCWTRTLDLIKLYLEGAGLGTQQFKRIDGDCPTAKRERILDEFAHSPVLRVLIMTTGTGAVGLNLATANRVFIVEPQWNPSVENQAIARALRIGQKQPVVVTRYVVDQTVEQDMRALQDTKMERANLVKGV